MYIHITQNTYKYTFILSLTYNLLTMSKTVEQIYQKKTQHEHVLTRPDMYIGSIEPITDDIWVYDEA